MTNRERITEATLADLQKRIPSEPARLADEAFNRSRRRTRNIEALILACGFGLLGGLCGLFLIWVTK